MDTILVETIASCAEGPRVAIKDTIDIAGHATRAASRVLADAPPAERDADVVSALRKAGCRIIGKANMHEFAYGVTGVNHWTGTAPNPLYPGLIPGGSSSGSAAAVAAGIADFALGTDTGGSIRMPAACCGVYGLKPSFGRVSRTGVMPAATTLDCVGPFARDMAMIEQAMAMIDPSFNSLPAPSAPRIGLVRVEAAEAVAATFADVVRRSGLFAAPVDLPDFGRAFDAGLAVIGAESWRAFGAHVDHPALGEDIRARLRAASGIDPVQLTEAEAVRARFAAQVDAALDRFDALALPTLPDPVPTLAEATDARAVIRVTAFVRPFNLSGHPAISLPLAEASGRPVGIQLVGRRGEDEALCAVARAFVASLVPARAA
ncbi:amidase [Sphingomonas oleivorans]|uniref:amidase n=1 Tax=Sphingomonas oleivorans TaxID=1735121 RepID=UPI001FAFC4A8|nr:amidase [Sphingomonas oleivorans]